jgi:hypothetical protein
MFYYELRVWKLQQQFSWKGKEFVLLMIYFSQVNKASDKNKSCVWRRSKEFNRYLHFIATIWLPKLASGQAFTR